jgi:hypothetical protein
VRNPPRIPPYRHHASGHASRQSWDPQLGEEHLDSSENDDDISLSWFRRTYPGYSTGDLADYYRRNRISPPIIANPENRFTTFKMRMVGLAANNITENEVRPQSTTIRKDDLPWLYVIGAAGSFAIAILLAAAYFAS